MPALATAAFAAFLFFTVLAIVVTVYLRDDCADTPSARATGNARIASVAYRAVLLRERAQAERVRAAQAQADADRLARKRYLAALDARSAAMRRD